jgi:hypothetical protein
MHDLHKVHDLVILHGSIKKFHNSLSERPQDPDQLESLRWAINKLKVTLSPEDQETFNGS